MSSSQGVVGCQRCGRDYIEEEFATHFPCMGEASHTVQRITVDLYYETASGDGTRTVTAFGLDGKVYVITRPPPEKLKALKGLDTKSSLDARREADGSATP